MERIKQLGYLTIGVADLDEGIEFYTRVARLHLADRTQRSAFLAGGTEHHWVKLEEGGPPGVRRVAFEVIDESALTAIRSDLSAQGIAYTDGGDMTADKVERWLRFTDPSGTDMELFVGMEQRPVAPPPGGLTMEKFLHAGINVPNFEATYAFYTQILGFRPSDYIGEMVAFMHCTDRYHHSLVLVRSDAPSFNHFCIQVESLDDVMRFRHNAIKYGAPLRDDLLKHGPSGSVGVYVNDLARGLAVEFAYDHPRVSDDHVPRRLPLTVETVDVWRAPLADLAPARARERVETAAATPAATTAKPETDDGELTPAFALVSDTAS